MSVAVRVIPCLDVKNGRVVKGVNFQGLRDAGDPVELARRYDQQGADEITFLDVSASSEGRATMLDVVSATAEQVFVPLTVGGGVRSVEDVDTLLRAGADKVGINTAAIARPELLSEVAERFGNQVVVLSVDARRCPPGVSTASGYEVTTHGGTRSTGIDAVEWARRAAELGAGEILLNSMDADGVTAGFDLAMLDDVRAQVTMPLIASGGAGRAQDFAAAADHGADAVLAASVFHYGTLTISQAKQALRKAGHPVRLATPAHPELDPAVAARLKRDAAGLVAAIIQEAETGQVLMLGWMNDEALRRTLTEGRVTFWSRSRQEYWRKGDTSGHAQYVRSVALDCDGDALLVQVDQVGAACHTGARSCFEAGGDLGAVVGHRDEPREV